MGKTFKNVLFFMLIVFTSTLVIPSKVYASNVENTVLELNEGEWNTLTDYDYIEDTETWVYYYYKITIPDNRYIKIEFIDTQNEKTEALKYLSVYSYIDENGELDHEGKVYSYISERTNYIRLPGGTYYLKLENTDSASVRFTTYPFKDNAKNYSLSRAKKLVPGKKVIFTDHGVDSYNRWYKIVLNKKQTITVYPQYLDNPWFSGTYDTWELFDSNRKKIKYTKRSGNCFRTKTLKAGTYYVVLLDNSYDSSGVHVVTGTEVKSFKWK